MEKNLNITNPRYNKPISQCLGTSLNRGSTVSSKETSDRVVLINFSGYILSQEDVF